jgi:hypothetical protein
VYFLQIRLGDAVAAQAFDQAIGGVVVSVEQGGAGGAGADQRRGRGEQKLESIQGSEQLVIGVGDVGLSSTPRLNNRSRSNNWGKP